MYCMANLKVVSLHSRFSTSQTLPPLQRDSLACSSIRDFRVVGSWLLKGGFLIGEFAFKFVTVPNKAIL